MSTSQARNFFSQDLCDQVVHNFDALLRSFDYKEELELFELGFFQFRLKHDLILEIKALYTALWKLCLCRSFPEHFELIFQQYLDTKLPSMYKKSQNISMYHKIGEYNELLSIRNNLDFTPISHHLLSLLNLKDEEARKMKLKVALHLRKTYTNLFECLF